jgi:PEP-CTERM motif
MRKALLLTTGLAWLALTGSAYAFTVTLTPGPMDPQYFEPEAANKNGFTLDNITWTLGSGTAETRKGSGAGEFAAPLGMGTSTTTGTTYMAVEANSSEVATFVTPQTSLALYWGSIDGDVCTAGSSSCGNLNQISIQVGTEILTGAELIGMGTPPVKGEGGQTDDNDNQLVVIKGLEPFTTVSFSTSGNAFEFALVPTIPEPSTWAMMLLGFAGLGYAAFRRNSKGQAAVAI